jgi:L-2-hydroxyglutarate oxidase LhgO
VPALSALFSPDTGILSADGLMDFLLRGALSAGASLLVESELVGLARGASDWEVSVHTREGREEFTSEYVVNAAGLASDEVAALAGIDIAESGYHLHYCKGCYFASPRRLSGILSRLVYPVPGASGLGVHVVLDLSGRLRFGPDAEYLPTRDLDYAVPPGRRETFTEAVRRLLPCVTPEDLLPDTAGIRPRLQAPGDPPRDFIVADEAQRGLPGLVNLVGIESPGLTAALAIAERVAALLGEP